MITEADIKHFSEQCGRIFTQVERDVVGQKDVIEGTIIAMIAGGNVLLEGVPGVGKTRLVRSLSRVFNMPFSRIQFTPDLMPADVTGTNIIVKGEDGNSQFSFQPGPIFSNIILADEINRATPKTQSALLEAMQEHTVTVMGVSRKLNEPFFVLATQNPHRAGRNVPASRSADGPLYVQNHREKPQFGRTHGDRQHDAEDHGGSRRRGVRRRAAFGNAQNRQPDSRRGRGSSLCDDALFRHASGQRLRFCRREKVRAAGGEPRAGQALISAAKVRALMLGRFNVSYSDLNVLAYPVLRHRMKLTFEAIAERISPDEIIMMIINELNGKKFTPVKATPAENPVQEEEKTEQAAEENAQNSAEGKKAKRGIFGRK